MPCGEIQLVVMIKNNIYPREIRAYSEFIFKAESLLTSMNESTAFAPKCLYTAFEPKNLLVFEDMRENGYKTLPRNHQLTYEQALPIIEKLAKLHATSAVLYKKDNSIMELFMEASISKNPKRQDFLVHYVNCARTLGSVASEWGDEWINIAEKLKALSKNIVQKSCDFYVRDDKSFNVFNHNDLWNPNVLFKFSDDEKILDILFVDFQLSYFGSPGIDLNFFIYGSLSTETRISSKHKLIKIYHQTLAKTLKILNFPDSIPTLHEIHVEFLKKGMNGLLAGMCAVPLLMIEQSDDLEMDLLLANSQKAEKFRFSLFSNPKYRYFIQNLLIEFDDLGYLD
jgi:thiamine kinase-like enzyme